MERKIRPALSRREFLRLAGAVGAGALLNACTSAQTPQPSSQPVQLVYQDWRTEWFPGMVQEALQAFHQEYPDIRVFYTPDPADVDVSLVKDMEAGQAPDVFAGCCTFFPILAQKGHTLDLRPLVEADLDEATLADWDPAQYQALFTRDGRQYGLPKYHGALALYYNKDIFDEFGVDYPDGTWDHDDYLEAMRRLTQDRDGDGEINQWGSMIDLSWDRIQMYVNAWGGHLVDPDDPTRSRMAEPEALQALEWLRARMWDDRVMATFLDVENLTTRQAFSTRKLAMVEDGSWALKDILTEANFRIGIAPLPAGPVRRVTLATTDGFGIYAGTVHPQESWELMKFLTGKDYGRAMARANFLQPARASLVEEWVDIIRQEFPVKTEGVDIAAFADGHIKGYSVTTEVFSNMDAATRLAYTAWDKILNHGEEPVEAMIDYSQQIEAAQQS